MGQNTAKIILGALLLLASAACGASAEPDSVATLSSETTIIRTDDLDGDEGSNDQQPVGVGEDNGDDPWSTPSAMLAAMATPIEVSTPDGVTIESVSNLISRDESRREVWTVQIVVHSELSQIELACLLEDQPPIPAGPPEQQNRVDCDELAEVGEITVVHGAPEVPLPTYDSFYDWAAPVTKVQPVGDDAEPGSPTVAITTMAARRQSQDVGDNLNPSDLAAPTKDLFAKIPRSSVSTSKVTWRPDQPNQISAGISLSSLAETGDELVAWMRTRGAPGTFTTDGATASTTLTGDPPVEMSWRAGSYRNSATVSFDYALDEDGRPITNPTIASEPIWIELIGWGGEWTYDADGIEDLDWAATDFDDSTWPIGEAPFGRDEPSTTNFATPAPGTTGWLRGRFTIDDPTNVERLDIEALVDDGFVVYLNGIEVHRWNLPAGPLTSDMATIDRISGDDELIVRRRTDVVTEALVAGENIIAVAIHQGAPDSSDMRFDLRLAATTRVDL